MKKILWGIFSFFVALCAGFLTTFISLISGSGIFLSLLLGGFIHIGGTWVLFYLLTKKKYPKEMVKQEQNYVTNLLNNAKQKVRKIQLSRFRIKSLAMHQTIGNLTKVANKIITLIEDEPTHYRGANRFFNTDINSAQELTEKYITLSNQPVQTIEVKDALKNCEEALQSLTKSMEKELVELLEDDILYVETESHVIKQSTQEMKQRKKMKW